MKQDKHSHPFFSLQFSAFSEDIGFLNHHVQVTPLSDTRELLDAWSPGTLVSDRIRVDSLQQSHLPIASGPLVAVGASSSPSYFLLLMDTQMLPRRVASGLTYSWGLWMAQFSQISLCLPLALGVHYQSFTLSLSRRFVTHTLTHTHTTRRSLIYVCLHFHIFVFQVLYVCFPSIVHFYLYLNIFSPFVSPAFTASHIHTVYHL